MNFPKLISDISDFAEGHGSEGWTWKMRLLRLAVLPVLWPAVIVGVSIALIVLSPVVLLIMCAGYVKTGKWSA